MLRFVLQLIFLLILNFSLEGKYPELTPEAVQNKTNKIFSEHVTYKKLSPLLVKRALILYVEALDPTKTYFTRSDIEEWINPSDEKLNQILDAMNKRDYSAFEQIYDKLGSVIPRHRRLQAEIDFENLPRKVSSNEFKVLEWVDTEQELKDRLTRIKTLQFETSAKLSEDLNLKALERIEKKQEKFEDEILTTDKNERQDFILTEVLKAISGSLDDHTAYFTPEEAPRFLALIQQRLFGIGVELRDDLNGFTIVKMIPGSPAMLSKKLKIKDRIIAINGEPIVGMDLFDVTELVRGEDKAPITLTIIRGSGDGVVLPTDEKLDVTINRGEIVLETARFESSLLHSDVGTIGYIRLNSFYRDPTTSSTYDLKKQILKFKEKDHIKGLILDLRNNSGGILSEAVGVVGLFISKGIVVSIEDNKGKIQHLRNMDADITWDGPLMVLVNRSSASAAEVVAGALQDYGRALIVGDDHTYGKGSFQTFSLNENQISKIDPTGEFKVTRGRYYTVSGKTPQLVGVVSDILVPGSLSSSKVGEKYLSFPLENKQIKSSFDDSLDDIEESHREYYRMNYRYGLQKQLHTYDPYIGQLKENSKERLEKNKDYQAFLAEVKRKVDLVEGEDQDTYGPNDLQLKESYLIMEDLIQLKNGTKEAKY